MPYWLDGCDLQCWFWAYYWSSFNFCLHLLAHSEPPPPSLRERSWTDLSFSGLTISIMVVSVNGCFYIIIILIQSSVFLLWVTTWLKEEHYLQHVRSSRESSLPLEIKLPLWLFLNDQPWIIPWRTNWMLRERSVMLPITANTKHLV